jgi:putative ABC transport system permease protein
MTEAVLLACLGGTAGIVVAVSAMRVLMSIAMPTLDRISGVRFDGAVFAFGVGVSLLTGIAVGILPTLAALRGSVASSLSGASSSVKGASSRWRRSLVVVQVSSLVVLLVGAGLTAGSVWRLAHLPLGFDPRGIVSAWIVMPGPIADDAARRAALLDAVLARLEGLPGVSVVSAATTYPFSSGALSDTQLPGGRSGQAVVSATDRNFFLLMKIPLKRGRLFEAGVKDGRVAVVNEEYSRRYFGGQDCLGKFIQVRGGPREIIGVVGSTTEIGTIKGSYRWGGLEASSLPWVYVPYGQSAGGSILLRGTASATVLEASIRSAVRGLGADLDVEVQPLEQKVARRLANSRFYALILGVLSMIALLLASVGIHGVVAQTVNQRWSELAVRLALGATPRGLIVTVVREMAVLFIAGAALGVAVTRAAAPVVRHFLFGVEPLDVPVVACALAVLAIAAGAAAYVPARRVTVMDVSRTLRCE